MARSKFQQDVLVALGAGSAEPRKKSKISMRMADPFVAGMTGESLTKDDTEAHKEALKGRSPLIKAWDDLLGGPGQSIERLAFETDPSSSNIYQSLWKRKLRLIPDEVLKRVCIQDDLVAAIVNTRSNQIAAFGRPQPDRFSTGFKIEPEPGFTENLDSDAKQKLQDDITEAETRILTCGSKEGWADQKTMSLGQYLFMSARNAVVFGRIATEVIYTDGPSGPVPHSFRAIDAGTIFKAAPQKEAAEQVRQNSIHLLEQIENKNLELPKYVNDEYSWVQVIEGRPVQAFGPQECLVHNFYPVTDIELDGYPVTPLDTVISAVTTHINITTHNKLYFQAGRAARGMIVMKSDDLDETVTDHIRQQFQASINSVGNAWRMPIFGIGPEDEIVWTPIDNSSRDMEFQYLSDTNARVILSAFQMSPEELPGYAHLSRGTNNQSLSESNNEYKLEAHRDVGIRPLIAQFQNFLNSKILPLFAPELAKHCHFKFVGLDVDTAEKESIRLQQDQAVHMTMDEVLERVEKKPVGKRFAGQFLLNPQWQQALDKLVTVGQQMEHFLGVEGASKDPRFDYLPNPLYFNQQQLLMQAQQMQQQAQQAQQQPQPGQGEGEEGSKGDEGPQDLSRSIDQLAGLLSKSESQLPPSKRRLLEHQRRVVAQALKGFEEDAEAATKEILAVAEKLLPASKKE